MQEFIQLQNSPVLFLSLVGLFSLLVGSFLNVVIFRYPQMLKKEWKTQAMCFLGEMNEPSVEPVCNLVTPRSQCPSCKHFITASENIPLVSFILLKGRCRHCQSAISWRYPFVEFLTAFMSVITAYQFGFSMMLVGALVLTWSLIVLAMIDYDEQILPDDITLPILWLGLTFNLYHTYVSLDSAIEGAILGYLFLWLIYWVFKLITHKEGMGYGDFKLLALLGAWLGWQSLPIIIIFASFTGALTGIGFILFKNHDKSNPIPFGPFLAMAGWITLLWGDKISNSYLKFALNL